MLEFVVYDCSFLLVYNMFWHFILFSVQIWTKMGISVTMSSTSSWKTPAMPCLATWFGTSSRNLTAIMTIRSALMSFCRYVNHKFAPSVQNFTYSEPVLFHLRPQRTSHSWMNRCVFALSVRACTAKLKALQNTHWRNVEVRSLQWFCAPVFGFSCVQRAFIPSFCYRSESLGRRVLPPHHILHYSCNEIGWFMQRCAKVSWCLYQFVTVVAHHNASSWAHGRNSDNYGFGKCRVHYPEAFSEAAESCILPISCTQQKWCSTSLYRPVSSEILDRYLLLNVGSRKLSLSAGEDDSCS